MGASGSKAISYSENGIPLLETKSSKALRESFKAFFSPFSEFENQDKVFNFACAEFKKYTGGKKRMSKEQFQESMAPLILKMHEGLRDIMEKNKGNKWFSLDAMGFGDDLPSRIFRIFDTDSNGTIDIGEYLIYFVFFRVEPFGRAVSFFVAMDRDGDGHLTADEVRRLFEVNVYAMLVSDQITEEQHKFIDQHAEEYVKEVDTNENNQVELIEFLESFKSFIKHVNIILTEIKAVLDKNVSLAGEDFANDETPEPEEI